MPHKYAFIKKSAILTQFFFETWSKLPSNEVVILTKSQKNWVKIADFLIKAYFWALCQFRLDILYEIHLSLFLNPCRDFVLNRRALEMRKIPSINVIRDLD